MNKVIVPLVALVMLAGCASVMSPSEYTVSLLSNVSGAKVTIYNRDVPVETATTPAEVVLSPKAGFYVPAKYRFVFEKEGCQGDEIAVDAKFNWWFAANFVTWGFVVGWFVDPATGAMWRLNESTVYGSLKPLAQQGGVAEPFRDDAAAGWIFQGTDSAGPTEGPAQDSQNVEINQLPL